MMKPRTGFLTILLGLLAFLVGCQKQEPLVIELKSDRFEVGSITSACEGVKSINGEKVSDLDLLNNTLIVKGQTIHCSASDLNTLGETLFIYEMNGSSKQFVVTMVDTIAPVIHLDNNEIGVEVNNEYFNLKDLINVTDNFDKELSFSLNGSYDIKVPGEYKVTLEAVDSSMNKSTKDVVVVVKEKEKEIITIIEEVPVYIGGTSGQKEPVNKPSNNADNSSSKPSEGKGNKPSGRKYLFSEGYTMQTAPASCSSDLTRASSSGWGGECKRLADNKNNPIGMELVIYD